MKPSLARIGIALALFGAALPAMADTRFQIRRMTRNDVPLGQGQCDVRLQVDNEVEVSVRRDMVYIHTISGRDPYDDGSECNAPLPDRQPVNFRYEVKDSRNDIRLIAEPTRRNDFAAVVLIRDSSGGQGRYHFRLTWDMTGPGDNRGPGNERQGPPPMGGGGFRWNGTVSFRGEGRGQAMVNGFDQRLRNVTVDIGREGRVVVFFQGERGRDLRFNGVIVAREGGRVRADMNYGNIRGPMWISLDRDDREVNSISMEGGDGRDRMRVNWDRR